MNWQPIETAPKDGEFLATDGAFLGIGYHHRSVEPDTVGDYKTWKLAYDAVQAPFGDIPWTGNGTWPPDFDYLAWTKKRSDAVAAADLKMPSIPNPKAGQVEEWYYASAFHAFDGETGTETCDGPVGFTPTHWMPLPAPPATARSV